MWLNFVGIRGIKLSEFGNSSFLPSSSSTLHYIVPLSGCMTRFIYSFVSVPLARYKWTEDIIQDARVLFGFRVLATCLDTFPVSCFLNDIAPTMFLYP
jgi:hypothetical protein